MGKPYQAEITRLFRTYKEALDVDIGPLAERIRATACRPLIAVGSGGSQTTAHLIAELHQRRYGQLAKAETPLVARDFLGTSSSTGLVLVSAGGRNPDILGIARAAVDAEPCFLTALCASRHSPLSRIVNSFSRGFAFEFDVGAGRDGFLATNSLLALSTVALRAYGFLSPEVARSFANLFTPRGAQKAKRISNVGKPVLDSEFLVVLYGSASRSAAYDLESKLIEAGLVSVQLSDYRNFAHGRHHWIAKNPGTAVIALAAKEEIALASHTLGLLPDDVPKRLLSTNHSGPTSYLPLQTLVFALVGKYGEARKIDPGRPGVPPFGRKIYHYNAFRSRKEDLKTTAIRRKRIIECLGSSVAVGTREHEYQFVLERLRSAKFHGLVLDYDGTVCDAADRFGTIPKATAQALRRVTQAALLLGVATGRGKSVRKALREAFPTTHWKHIWVAYYNGGAIGRLDDDKEPDSTAVVPPELQSAAQALEKMGEPKVLLTVRPQQITIENDNVSDVHELWRSAVRMIMAARIEGLKVVVSTRSVDVIPAMTSKLNLLAALDAVRPNSTFLCIGDRPRWPGNDAELLGHQFSLSVDEVEAGPGEAWNLAPAGVLGSAALRYYLRQISIRTGYFAIRIGS